MRNDFRKIMKKEREKKGISKSYLAAKIGKSPQLICDIEAGRKNPGSRTLVDIARELNISLDDIFL